MLQSEANSKIRHLAANFIVAGALGLLGWMPATASQSVALDWKPSTDPRARGYQIFYGPASHTYTNAIAVGNVTNAIISGLVAGTTYYFSAKTFDAAGGVSGFSNETSCAVPVIVANTPPTLNPIANVSVSQNAAATAISLTGISPGATNEPAIKATVTSSNPALIANATIAYVSQASTGTLIFQPAANKTGTAILTVTLSNGGQSSNTFSRSFTVNVVAATNARAAAPIPTATIKAITREANSNFSFQVAGVAGCKYVIQASSDLVHWISVQTNTAPFTFTDTHAASYQTRFYRALTH